MKAGRNPPDAPGRTLRHLVLQRRKRPRNRPHEVDSQKYRHQHQVQVLAEAKAGVGHQNSKYGQAEACVQEAPRVKIPQIEPAPSFAQRHEQPDQAQTNQRKT